MEDYKKKYEEALERAKKYNIDGLTLTVKEVIEHIFPEFKKSKDDMIREALLELVKQSSHILNPMKQKSMIAWLERQSKENMIEALRSEYEKGKFDALQKQEQLYIRFGEIPTDEKSRIYRGEVEVGTENGVSVYPAFKTKEGDIVLGLTLPITKTTLYTQQYLLEYENRPCYLVKGDYVGKDTDGQPLINNISIIKKIDGYRVKGEKQTWTITMNAH